MAKKIKRNMLKLIWNRQGQMAIFMILIFQILFIFFSMVVNIALVVHDKINLQNAVDLAAYYGAQKQAELLNTIAHSNYQIRQSFKLLTYRSRVLGVLGVTSNPITKGNLSESPWPDVPSICVTNQPFWYSAPDDQNLCRRTYNRIPALPRVNIVFSGAINIGAIARSNNRLIAAYNSACESHGGANWFFAMRILTAFRYDQANRKAVLWALGDNLMKEDFNELSGSPVSAGVKKTLMKNLTFQNRGQSDTPSGGAESNVQFNMLNSMSITDLSSSKDWLAPIFIDPTLIYSDVTTASGCTANPKSPLGPAGLPDRPNSFNFLASSSAFSAELSILKSFALTTANAQNILSTTLGVEKNPWYMVYFGVQAKTSPRQIFFPFGPTIQLTARAYAKPFGGRIGPWYAKNWPSGSMESSGGETDALAPVRMRPLMGTTCQTDNDGCRRIPNHSRFPGDKIGMRSNLAYNVTKLRAGGGIRPIGNMLYYNNIVKEFTDDNQANDIMAWNAVRPTDARANAVRDLELSAVQPDLFDASYYSIQPHYGDRILPLLKANKTQLGIPNNVALRGDLGSRGGTKSKLKAFNVHNQIQKGAINTNIDLAFYRIKTPAHLLTDWVSKGAIDYDFPDNAFGLCGPASDPEKFLVIVEE